MTTFEVSAPIQARTRLRPDGGEDGKVGASRAEGHGPDPSVACGVIRVDDAELVAVDPAGPQERAIKAAGINIDHFMRTDPSTPTRPNRYPQNTSSDFTNVPR
jgi:hypothetical protein